MKKLKDQKNRGNLRNKTMHKAYANATRSIATGLAALMIVSFPVIHSVIHAESWFEPVSHSVYDNSENQESIRAKVLDTAQPSTTAITLTSVTSVTTTSTTTSIVTTVATTEEPTEEYVEDKKEEYYEYEEDEEYNSYELEDYYEEPDNSYSYSEGGYAGSFIAKYYPGSEGSYGYSSRTLISGYSVASNYFPQGTLLYITGGGLDGTYRVDDTSWEMPSNVIDFFYTYGSVPSDFEYAGVYPIEVYVVGYY